MSYAFTIIQCDKAEYEASEEIQSAFPKPHWNQYETAFFVIKDETEAVDSLGLTLLKLCDPIRGYAIEQLAAYRLENDWDADTASS